MHRNSIISSERPAFVKIVDRDLTIDIDGYILDIENIDQYPSIINSKKGGKNSMLKTIVKALEGFEKYFNELTDMKAHLETERDAAVEDVKSVLAGIEEKHGITIDTDSIITSVEDKFAVKAERIENALNSVSETEEIEVPDENNAVVDTETAEVTDVVGQ